MNTTSRTERLAFWRCKARGVARDWRDGLLTVLDVARIQDAATLEGFGGAFTHALKEEQEVS